jgi:TIR domain-containing protein
MPDCFISYSTKDQKLAEFVRAELQQHGLSVFMAQASLKPGQQWSDEIRANLKASDWVLFLASSAACESPWVQQELGMAIGASKRLIPTVWDLDPSNLPGWVSEKQALNLRGASVEQLKARMAAIARSIKQEKAQGWLILGAIVFGLMVVGDNRGK